MLPPIYVRVHTKKNSTNITNRTQALLVAAFWAFSQCECLRANEFEMASELVYTSRTRGALTLLPEADPVAGDSRTILWEGTNMTLGTSIGPCRDNEP